MNRVRAKFSVTGVFEDPAGFTQVEMMPVASDDPESENHRFWEATPAGRCELHIDNPEAAAFFEAGDEVYVDFEKTGHRTL